MAINSRYKLKTGEEVDYFPPIQNTDNPYATEAAMHADQANQLEGYGYLVDGVGAFTYLGTLAGTAADYEGFGGGVVPSLEDVTQQGNSTSWGIDINSADGLTDLQVSNTTDGSYSFLDARAVFIENGVTGNQGFLQSDQIGWVDGASGFQKEMLFPTVLATSQNILPISVNGNFADSEGNIVVAQTIEATNTTGTALNLSNVVGNNYNYAAFSSATTYTVGSKVVNGFARCFINAASQPTVTGATYLTAAGDVFQSNTEMEMVVESPNGTIVEFYFLKR